MCKKRSPQQKTFLLTITIKIMESIITVDMKSLLFSNNLISDHLPDFLYSCSQCVVLNEILSSPFSVKAGVPQGSVLGPGLFLIFINDLSDSLENPLYLLGDDSTLCHDIPHPSDRWTAASSLSSDLEKNRKLDKLVECVFHS